MELGKSARREMMAPGELGRLLDGFLSDFDFIKPLTKRHRVIAALFVASIAGKWITRFDTESIGDHCLNSTISQIGKFEGIYVHRRETKRPTRFGSPTYCKEYALDGVGLADAEALLLSLTRRKAA